MRGEVLPYVPDAWVDYAKTKIGYEIPLTRHFYKYVPPRPLAEIDAEIKAWRMRFSGCWPRWRVDHRCTFADPRQRRADSSRQTISLARGASR